MQFLKTLLLSLILFSPSLYAVEPQIVTTAGHVLHLRADGSVWAWGEDVSMNNPRIAANVINIATGKYHHLAVKNDGTLWGWGISSYFPNASENTYPETVIDPVQLPITNVKSVVITDTHQLILKNDGTVWAWGNNSLGQLGYGLQDEGYHNAITQVTIPASITAIAAGGGVEYGYGTSNTVYAHSLALDVQGNVWGWGGNGQGQLGLGDTVNRLTPVQLPLTNVVQIAAGAKHSIALTQDNHLWSWGLDYNGNAQSHLSPQIINITLDSVETIERIVAGGAYSMVKINAKGASIIKTWGRAGWWVDPVYEPIILVNNEPYITALGVGSNSITPSSRFGVIDTDVALLDSQGHVYILERSARYLKEQLTPVSFASQKAKYSLYMPEGFLGNGVTEFVTVLNSSDVTAYGYLQLTYEYSGLQSYIPVEFPPKQRSTIDLFAHKQIYVSGTYVAELQHAQPFAMKLVSYQPITASLTHYDNGIALGSEFTETTHTTWRSGLGLNVNYERDYLCIEKADDANPTDITVTLTHGLTDKSLVYNVPTTNLSYFAGGRLSVFLQDIINSSALANEFKNAPFSITVNSGNQLVAALSHYDDSLHEGTLTLLQPDNGSATGYIAEGWLAGNAFEIVDIFNPNTEAVTIDWQLMGGVTKQFTTTIPAGQKGSVLLNDHVGKQQDYALGYQAHTANGTPANIVANFSDFDEISLNGVPFVQPRQVWEFSEGFINNTPNMVREYLLFANPSNQTANVKLQFYYDLPIEPTVINLSIPPKAKGGLAPHDDNRLFRRSADQVGTAFGVRVESDIAIVPYFVHFDYVFGGSFAMTGMPK